MDIRRLVLHGSSLPDGCITRKCLVEDICPIGTGFSERLDFLAKML